MKTKQQGYLHPAHPMSPGSSSRQPCEVVAPECKRFVAARAGKAGGMLQIPLRESVRKSATKPTTRISTGGGQLGSAVRQRRLPDKGK